MQEWSFLLEQAGGALVAAVVCIILAGLICITAHRPATIDGESQGAASGLFVVGLAIVAAVVGGLALYIGLNG